MTKLPAIAAMGCALVGHGETQDDYTRWRPLHILGKEKTFYCQHTGGPGTAMDRSYFPVVGGWGDTQGLNDIWWFTGYFPEKMKFQNTYYWGKVNGKDQKIYRKLPYTVWDTMGPDVHYNHAREDFKRLHETRPDVPFLLKGFCDSCFPWFMKDKYDCDVQSFEEFRKAYTNFVAITTLNESDGGFGGFNSAKGVTNLKMRAEMDAAFPPAKTYKDRVKWMERAMERQKAMYFGSEGFQSTYSSNSKWGHVLAKYGIKYLEYECDSQVLSGPWRFSMMHIRGVGRQYQIPWTWYAAHLITTYSRDGKTSVSDEWHFPNKWRPKEKWPKNYHENCGTANSIVKRSHVYGYFAGANAIAIENPHYCLMDDLVEKPKLTKYGQDLEDVMQMAEKTPRGFCYTPIAVLTSVYEGFSRSGNNGYGTDAFFFTLVPVLSENGYTHRDEKKGEQGIMFNSEFGEIADVLTPDAAQPAGDFAKALAPYKWAFMMGTYDENDFERGAVLDWVNKGGTLVTSVDYVGGGHAGRVTLPGDVATGGGHAGRVTLPGGGRTALDDGRGTRPACPLISANMAGVDFTTNVVTCGKELIEHATKRICEGSMCQTFRRVHCKVERVAPFDYELHVGKPTTAKPLYTDENGNVIAWENACGKGKVITYTAVQGVPRLLTDRKKYYKDLPIDDFFGIKPEYVAGRITFPLQRELLRKCQRETMPVEVSGDIQWGVNYVEGGHAGRVTLPDGGRGTRPACPKSNNQTIKQSNDSSHWLVWLLNNKGVKKFSGEDDDINHAFDAKVRITNKKTGKTVEKIVPAGGYDWVAI